MNLLELIAYLVLALLVAMTIEVISIPFKVIRLKKKNIERGNELEVELDRIDGLLNAEVDKIHADETLSSDEKNERIVELNQKLGEHDSMMRKFNYIRRRYDR